MKRDLGDGYELDDDPDRIDVAAVHRFLSRGVLLGAGPRRTSMQERLIRAATRVVGLYHDGRQIGFCRAVETFGVPDVYLADVYVLTEHRGRGLGVELIARDGRARPVSPIAPGSSTPATRTSSTAKFGFGKPGPEADGTPSRGVTPR